MVDMLATAWGPVNPVGAPPPPSLGVGAYHLGPFLDIILGARDGRHEHRGGGDAPVEHG